MTFVLNLVCYIDLTLDYRGCVDMFIYTRNNQDKLLASKVKFDHEPIRVEPFLGVLCLLSAPG